MQQDTPQIAKRRAREEKTISQMVALYCADNHELPAGPKPPYAAKQCARNAPSLTNTRRCARADAAKCT